jgi:hypothetical protein
MLRCEYRCIDDTSVHIRHDRDETKVKLEFHPGPFSRSWWSLVSYAAFDLRIDLHHFNTLKYIPSICSGVSIGALMILAYTFAMIETKQRSSSSSILDHFLEVGGACILDLFRMFVPCGIEVSI